MTNQSTNFPPARIPPDRVIITGPGYNPYKPVRALASGKNMAASFAVFLGIVAVVLVAVPFGSGDRFAWVARVLVAAGAVAWGTIGIIRSNGWARDGYRPAGRARSIWGVVLGALVLLVGLLALIGVVVPAVVVGG